MRQSEAEGRFGGAEPVGCASIRALSREACNWPPYAVLVKARKMPGGRGEGAVLGACQGAENAGRRLAVKLAA
ncbi:MAG: hypothetical protein J6R18_02600, partial [Kiritimatiellae bacterium]|nr:hypothetical protein [Kiritimatiellia bacterium]